MQKETQTKQLQKKKIKPRHPSHPGNGNGRNTIRVTVAGAPAKYIAYALTLLQDKKPKKVTLLAMGRAIATAVQTCEAVRQCLPGIHQVVSIGVQEVDDIREPLPRLERSNKPPFKRQIATIEIHLSTNIAEMNTASPGYQAPRTKEQIMGLRQVECALGVKSFKHHWKRYGPHTKRYKGKNDSGYKGKNDNGYKGKNDHTRSRRVPEKGRGKGRSGQGGGKGAKRQPRTLSESQQQNAHTKSTPRSSKESDKTKKA